MEVKIDEVVVLGEVTLTASALHLLLERDIEITYLGHYGQFKGRLITAIFQECAAADGTIPSAPGYAEALRTGPALCDRQALQSTHNAYSAINRRQSGR